MDIFYKYTICVFIFGLATNKQLGSEAAYSQVENVHVIFMNHLDVGYDGISPQTGFINNILNVYFHEHFPRAVNLSEEIRAGGYVETFIYTTHPWLVHLYMHCPTQFILNNITLKCPNDADIKRFTSAVQRGDITWHAGPMNMQIENMNQNLFDAGLSVGAALDKMFSINRTFKVLSQRDVPGMTHAVIPVLQKSGIGGVSVGVNPGTSPPAVPNLFTWKYEDNEVVAMWHAGGYPLNPGPNPAHPGGLSTRDCIKPDNFTQALCFAFRTDNSGPPQNVQEILDNYEILRKEFPGANIRASKFEVFLEAIQPIKAKLPVVTKEIGDTWIQGIASDPRKMAEYRSVSRTLTDCINTGECSNIDTFKAQLYLMKLPEHTWGLPSVGDNVNWSNPQFNRARSGKNYRNCEFAWLEQREFLRYTTTMLEGTSVHEKIQMDLDELQPSIPNLMGFEEANPLEVYKFSYDGAEIAFNTDGTLTRLYDPYNNVSWAKGNAFGTFFYMTYNEDDFNFMAKQYSYYGGPGFQKLNSTRNAHPESRPWGTKLEKLYKWQGHDFVFMAKLSMADPKSHTWYGGPEEIWVTYVYKPGPGAPGFDVTLQWFNKTSTRLPESLMFVFAPIPIPPVPPPKRGRKIKDNPSSFPGDYKWYLEKLGRKVNVSNVLLNGSQYVHAVDESVFYIDDFGHGLQLVTKDVPLVSINTIQHAPSPFPVPLAPILEGQVTGVAFNMYNNIWDTNYILWYPYNTGDENFKARFQIKFLA